VIVKNKDLTPYGPGIETKPLCGEFYNLRDDILNWCGPNDFAFFFIDPKGWKKAVEIPTLLPFLTRPKSEILINFMFDFLRRFHSKPEFEEDMKEIFSKVPDTMDMPPDDKEDYMMNLYINHIKDAQNSISGKPRCAYVKILDPCINKTKYDLIYLTRHSLGIKVFYAESEQLDFIQRQVRAEAKQKKRMERTGQMELFPDHKAIVKNKNDIDIEIIKSYWLSKLSNQPKMFGVDELADMLEETGWFESDLQRAFRELQKEKKVSNLNAQRIRPVYAVHFDHNEHLVKI